MIQCNRLCQAVLLIDLVVAVLGCSGTNGSGNAAGTGGATVIGGASSTGGGTSRGGTVAAAGSSTTGGNATGGALAAGGSLATGGASATGGKNGIGGASTGGVAATGGTNATGGTASTGGSKNSGGTSNAGGAGAGGAVATGGTKATGGTASTGGSKNSGGTSSNGGVTTTGGTRTIGGMSATGGMTTTGGSSGMGGSTAIGSINVSWDFNTDSEGWIGGFADYPPNIGTGYDLAFGWAALPAEVGPGGGLRISGNNHSDDLFMFVMREITGLVPQTTYLLDVVVVIDTNAPNDCTGIGGAPGTSVFFKIGASAVEPATSLDSQGYLRLNIDKGNQSAGGADMKVVGDIGNTNTCPNATYQFKTLTLSVFSVTSAADGTLWVILGTDSGFEGITTLYYDRISIALKPSQ